MSALKNDLLLRTIAGESVERPPVWLMRQAGRILPQYRAVRASLSGFIELVKTPELVAEVTIQPVDELGVDAAITFSDILVIPECMGLAYEMIEKKGPFFPDTIRKAEDIAKLDYGQSAADRLTYVYDGLDQTKAALDDRVPLIGFAGAPWTLMCYMVEGSGSKTFSKAKRLLYRSPDIAHALLSKITDTIIAYLQHKVAHGADVIQVFDSWAGVLDRDTYSTFCIPYLSKIFKAINPLAPTICFSKGAWFSLEDIQSLSPNVLGIDWNTDMTLVRDKLGQEQVVQGNLDPCVLYADHDEIRRKTIRLIEKVGGHHVVNLGHGVYPDTPLDGVKAFVDTVKSYSYSR